MIHRSTALTRTDVARRRGIPVTSYARTLRDLGYGPERTRSELERAFLKLCRDNGIPDPKVNEAIGPYTVDFLWFEADRARDVQLQRWGFTVLRFTYRQVTSAPAEVAGSIRAQLAPA